MDFSTDPIAKLPPEQEAIRARCYHPTGSFVEFPKEEIEQSIPERFEKIVRMYPERVAVKSKNHSLTYSDLNGSANRVAHAILDRCAVGQKPVALLLENDAPMISSILGVLKSGALYVPLDPAHPLSRMQYLLEDSGSALILSNSRYLALAAELANGKVPLINIDTIPAACNENPARQPAPHDLAYILYTSGSTGKPKGVVQNHRNSLHLIMRYTNRSSITKDDRLPLLRSFSVNGGTLHTFAALLNGATILPFSLKEEGITGLGKWLIDEEITFFCGMGATAVSHFLTSLTQEERFPKLRMIAFSGEPLHKRHLQMCWRHLSPECVVVNSLGATEASNVCDFVIDRDTSLRDAIVPGGYPTRDMEVLLLDEEGAEIGTNRVGEIAVKSRYIAVGYWRRPELTKKKFLSIGEQRLYLTGDLGLKRADGCLIYVGRKDFQVKIRGYRVEMGEVEATLLDLDNVGEAAVVARENPAGEKSLVAYIVPKTRPAPTVTALRRALRNRMPDYMVPSVFMVLDQMPVTPNGKLLRSALPSPPQSRPDLDCPFVPPRTPVEEKLAHIWAEVLSLDQVGIYDNFFDLGGHSLAATRVVSQVINQFQLELPLQSLFQSPTVAEMATVITEHQAKKLDEKDLARILAELESMSDDEAQKSLAKEFV